MLAVGIASGWVEGGGVVIGGLCEGTWWLDGVVDRYSIGIVMGMPVEVMFVLGVGGKGSKLEVIDGRDRGKGRSSWKWALDCHNIMFES